jgi:anhydro-N-acetylmuramic acid kinase
VERVIVAGVMSGTSADGIDVALISVSGSGIGYKPQFQLLRHAHFPYPEAVKKAVLKAMNAGRTSVAELSRLNFLLGELYAEAVNNVRKRAGLGLDLVGCHGQTIYHQGEGTAFLGRNIACTWQTGEGAVIAARLGVPVVSDFRPADMAAGGKGAPLVPFLDYALFRRRRTGRILQNLGGIANLTAIPTRALPKDVLAFDTGPGNMVIDQLMQKLFGKPYDRNGETARRGKILQPVLEHFLNSDFLRLKPPKTAGREEFGREFAQAFLRRCRRAPKADVVATATALTVQSIVQALREFVLPSGKYREYIVSGGGTRNRTLMRMLAKETAKLGLRMRHSDEVGIPSQAKEALAFALLAYQTWLRLPGNIPSATGAAKPAVLGKISYA